MRSTESKEIILSIYFILVKNYDKIIISALKFKKKTWMEPYMQ